MSTQPRHLLTEDEYLALDRAAERKSEYCDGEMVAMSGASYAHNIIVKNCLVLLDSHARERGCEVVGADMRVHIRASRTFVYPDVTVICGKPNLLDNDILLNPIVVIEILSASTEGYDRGRKFDAYRDIESLREYVLVSQDRLKVEVFARESSDTRKYRVFEEPQAAAELPSLEATLPLSGIYRGISFEAS
jgi:Uma2 family endonuclease